MVEGDKFLVLGYKGSGKSAFAQHLELMATDNPNTRSPSPLGTTLLAPSVAGRQGGWQRQRAWMEVGRGHVIVRAQRFPSQVRTPLTRDEVPAAQKQHCAEFIVAG